MSSGNGSLSNETGNVGSEKETNIQKISSAIEDLLYMEAIKFKDVEDKQNNKAILSSQFMVIVSHVISSMNFREDNSEDMMRLMYLSLMIYLNEHLKLPKSLTISFGKDLEKHRDDMECAELISNYVIVLHNIFSSARKERRS